MNDDQPTQPTTPGSSVTRLPFVTEEEAVAPATPSFPPTPVLSSLSSSNGSTVPATAPLPTQNNDVPQATPAPLPSSVVPPVISPPVKKKVSTKLVVAGSILALLLVSVPFGVYFLMSQNQDTREKATYDYVPAPAPDLTQNEAPPSVNSDSLNGGVVPAQDSGEEVDPNSSAPLEGETAQ